MRLDRGLDKGLHRGLDKGVSTLRSARRRKRRPAWETLMELRCWDMNVSTYKPTRKTHIHTVHARVR